MGESESYYLVVLWVPDPIRFCKERKRKEQEEANRLARKLRIISD